MTQSEANNKIYIIYVSGLTAIMFTVIVVSSQLTVLGSSLCVLGLCGSVHASKDSVFATVYTKGCEDLVVFFWDRSHQYGGFRFSSWLPLENRTNNG